MATKAELAAAIAEILGTDPIDETAYTHAELEVMLATAKEEKAAQADELAVDELAVDELAQHTVAAGKAITTIKRGILEGGAVITADDVNGFDNLVEKGYIV